MSSIEEAFEESGRQVALTGVSDNDDDRLSSELWTSDYLTGSLQGPATGDTRDNALFCGSATGEGDGLITCLLYTSPSPRDRQKSRMPSSA